MLAIQRGGEGRISLALGSRVYTQGQGTLRTACHLLMREEAFLAALPAFFFLLPSRPAPIGAISTRGRLRSRDTPASPCTHAPLMIRVVVQALLCCTIIAITIINVINLYTPRILDQITFLPWHQHGREGAIEIPSGDRIQ